MPRGNIEMSLSISQIKDRSRKKIHQDSRIVEVRKAIKAVLLKINRIIG